MPEERLVRAQEELQSETIKATPKEKKKKTSFVLFLLFF
jgi:hypothetical protein